MTLEQFKTEYASDIRNHDVSVLRANRKLMLLCYRNSEFKAYVLSVRPEMEREPNPYPCKFKKREKFVSDEISTKPVVATKTDSVSHKPTMAKVRVPVVEFKKKEVVTVVEPAKSAHAPPVAREDKASIELVNQFKKDYDLI
jgi:hypothetical protein